jgi:hypothetical protein
MNTQCKYTEDSPSQVFLKIAYAAKVLWEHGTTSVLMVCVIDGKKGNIGLSLILDVAGDSKTIPEVQAASPPC